jgi:hypothetical protein
MLLIKILIYTGMKAGEVGYCDASLRGNEREAG